MHIGNEKEILGRVLDSPEVKNASMKVLLSEAQGWEDYVMRIIELDEDGYSPKHSHPWPHINYMIEGKGLLNVDGKNTPAKSGSYSFVPPNTLHQFTNDGPGKFRFICIVPKEGHI